jgi:hypothetical protein
VATRVKTRTVIFARPFFLDEVKYNRRSALGWNDRDRHNALLKAAEGKRLTYRRIGEASLA